MSKKVSLADFVVKNISFEEKVKIISCWEEDRGSDGESVYDLENEEDAKHWLILYGLDNLYHCHDLGRWWIGGHNFSCYDANKQKGNRSVFRLSADSIENLFSDVLSEIENMFKTNWRDYNDKVSYIAGFERQYKGLIDFNSYYKATKIVNYMWVATSNDGSFQAVSEVKFDQKIDCYNNMRSHALKKMEWNTQFNEDFSDGLPILYSVQFTKERIASSSYSGIYLYKIIPSNEFVDNKEFWDKLKNETNEICFL